MMMMQNSFSIVEILSCKYERWPPLIGSFTSEYTHVQNTVPVVNKSLQQSSVTFGEYIYLTFSSGSHAFMLNMKLQLAANKLSLA